MTVIELVGVGVLDVKDDSPFSLNFQAQDVLDPSSRTSNFSKSISLVGSDNNNKILGFVFDINISDSTFNVNKLVECNVIQNGVNVFDTANFQLLSIDENPNGEIVYTGRVTSKTTDFFTKIKNKELQDLPMPVYGKGLSKADVIGSFGNVENDLFKFIALPNDLSSTIYDIRNFKPAIFLKTYFDAIHQAAGFVYNFDEWEDLNFDRLIIPNVNKIEANEELEEANNILYLNTSSATYPVASGLTSNLNFGVTQIDQNSQFNNSTSTYTPNVSSKLVVEVEANIFFKMAWSGNGGRANGGAIKYELQAIVESDNYLSNKIVMADFLSGQVVPFGNQIVFTNKVNFQIPITAIQGVDFSNIKFKVVQSGGGQWVDNFLNTPMNVPIEIEVAQIGIRSINDLSYNYGLPVYLKDFVPKKIKQSDFIKSICQMFNLVIITDAEKPNEIKYITRDKWYDDGKEVDWTNKADISKAIRKEWIQDKQAKQINLKYKADEDSVNKAYQDNFEQTFGAYEFEFENEFNTQESDEEIIFSPTPTVFNSNSNMYLPALTDGKQNIRILIDNGEKTDGYYYIKEEDGSNGALINNYAQALHIDDPNYPTFDINFGIASMYFHQLNRPTKNNLFNLRHFRKFSQLANGRLLTMYFVLNEIDVNKLELNDRIWVKDGFYNINKISNYNANGKQSTKVELITVDDGIRLDRNKIIIRVGTGVGVFEPQPWHPNNPVIGAGIKGVIDASIRYDNNIIGGNTGVIIGTGNNIASGFKGVIIGDNLSPTQDGIFVGENTQITEGGVKSNSLEVPGLTISEDGNVNFSGAVNVSGDIEVDSIKINNIGTTTPIGNLGYDANGNVVIGAMGGNMEIVPITYSALKESKASNLLIPGTRYYIADRDIWIDALDINKLSLDCKRHFRIVKDEHYTPHNEQPIGTYTIEFCGIYGQKYAKGSTPNSITGVAGNYPYAIWGGRMWSRNSSGVDTPGTSDTIIAGGWTMVVTTNDLVYESKIFDIKYNFDDDKIWEQSDDRGNIIKRLSASTSYIDITDWGNTFIYNNENFGIFNNFRNATTKAFIYNNSNLGNIFNNLNNGIIASNSNSGNIFNNSNLGDILNNSNNGIIAGNLNNGAIYNNSNNGVIVSNSNTGNINTNSNNGEISLNKSNVTNILSNTNNDRIYNNNNTGNIESNSNNGSIDGNTNLGYITRNGNGGYIRNNSNRGYILENFNGLYISSNSSNLGTTMNILNNNNSFSISSNKSISGICDIRYNNNNGHIGDTPTNRTAYVDGTVVNK